MTATDTGQRGGNGRALDMRPSIPAPSRLGQGTAVEQSRAVAEVEAAIVVAQRVPRDIDRAVRDMYRSCGQRSLAEKSHFRFKRGKENISGATIQLARELARCWGNVQYGITELRRDDAFGQSEMQAWAWDVQTNTRASTTFIVPHTRDTRDGAKPLVDARDIYENNANMGARRLREMIFGILPGWYTEDAETACYETLAGDPEETAARTTACVDGFARLGVTQAQIEQKLGGPRPTWTPYDLAQLQVIYRSITRGEVRKEDEFPAAQDRVTAAEITGQQAPAAGDDTRSRSASRSPEGERERAAGESTAREDDHPRAAGAGPSRGAQPPAPQGQPASKGMALKLDKLLGHLQLGPEEDVRALLEHLCGGPYTATRAQVQLVTGILEDHLHAAGGDPAEAAPAIWAQFHAATAQAGAEASQDAGGSDG